MLRINPSRSEVIFHAIELLLIKSSCDFQEAIADSNAARYKESIVSIILANDWVAVRGRPI